MKDGGGSNHEIAQQSSFDAAVRHCCSKCRDYLKTSETKQDNTNGNARESFRCWLCLGLWQEEGENGITVPTTTTSCLGKALEECCSPYGGIGRNSPNRFSQLANQCHTVSLSGDLCLRYRWLTSISPSSSTPLPFSVYLQDLKQHLYARIESIIQKDSHANGGEKKKEENSQWVQDHQYVFEKEEQGSLSIHLLCLPPKDHPLNLALNNFTSNHKNSQRTKKQRKRYNKRQKCGPFTTQGGDPRQNLEVRLRLKGYEWISQSTAEELSSAAAASSEAPSLESTFLPDVCKSFNEPLMMMEYHVAVFRRPMFLYGYYTKSRRDVSQTPFVVMREKLTTSEPTANSTTTTPNNIDSTISFTKEAEILGVTSVEEQICGPIQDLLGVSTQNNLMPDIPSDGGGGVLYGMIKFHASGREDMDVRMLVRSESSTCHGRPFCVQVIDALNPIVSPNQLKDLAETINQIVTGTTSTSTEESVKIDSGDGLCNTVASYYGQNPMGVGILPNALRLVPAAIFSGLQKDTESKTKHYGCYCWSKDVLPDEDDLTKVLFRNVVFPLTIQQRTPLRVLHRRTNSIRERNVLYARATKIDDHHFRLELSTQAGTYVKEFIYGDFGRTIPSVSSLMGCKTNLLKLDCEGIEIPKEENF
jgi:tRNA U54 and U55 pseudouridine synthase Pus10